MQDMLNKTINLSHTRLLYNPQLQDADTVERLFVVRQKQFELLLNKILQEKENSIPQHYLIIGQRGMGKTTMLKRMEVELHKPQYRQRFIPLLYHEEQYNLKDIAEFWLNTLDALADSLQSEEYPAQMVADVDKNIMELSRKSSKIISENAYKYLMEICHDLHRRPVLLIDNIELVFNRLDNNNKNNTEQWALRKLLSENGAPIVVSGGVTLTDSVNIYGKPFFDFFQIQKLYKLDYEEFTKLLINLATVTNSDKKIIDSIHKNSSRQKSLLKLTGGSPRLAVMLFEQIAKGFSSNINDDLEILADAITPLYKARFEELSAQQQIILDAIALNWDAISLKELSIATHMQNNQLSPQLKRLIDDGWLETTPAYRAKGNAYFISERFFNIYYLIRNSSRRHKDKVYCLSKFLECFYGKEDLKEISRTLLIQNINSPEEMRLYLALSDVKTLELSQREKMREKVFETILTNEELSKEFDFPSNNYIKAISLLKSEQYGDAINYFNKAINEDKNNETIWCLKGHCLFVLEKYSEALACFDKALDIDGKSDVAWFLKGRMLSELGKDYEAIECFDSAIKINPKQEIIWSEKGDILIKLEHYEDAIKCIDQAINLKSEEDEYLLVNRAICLFYLKHYEESLKHFNKATELNPNEVHFWFFKGELLNFLQRFTEALDCFENAIKLDPGNDVIWTWKGNSLYCMGKFTDAFDSLTKAIELNEKNETALFWKINCLYIMKKYDETFNFINEVIKKYPDNLIFLNQKGNMLIDLQRFEDAIDCFDKAIKKDTKDFSAWANKGHVLIELQNYPTAVETLKEAIKLYDDDLSSKFNLIFLYRDKLNEMEKAIELFNSIDENKINENENKYFVCDYYLHKALFELHKNNSGLAREHLLQAFEIMDKEEEITSIANMYWWVRFGSAVIKLDYGSWLISILEEKGYDIVLSPYYTAIKVLEIEKDSKTKKNDAKTYLKNRAVEISDTAEAFIEKFNKYMY
jgi:tetratricopeptide (TPR) repeat protein